MGLRLSIRPISPAFARSSASTSAKAPRSSAAGSTRSRATRPAGPSRRWRWSSCSSCLIATRNCSKRSGRR